MRPIRLAATGLALIALLVALSGCYAIRSQTVSQLDVIGDVQIETTTCIDSSGPTPVPGCPASNDRSSSNPPTNWLIAYRLPDGVGAPDSFSQTSGAAVTFTKDDAYTASLTSVAPPPSGEHWVGYRGDSAPTTGDSTFQPHFTLPRSAGAPFQGPLNYRTVTGFIMDGSPNGDDPVVCNSDPATETTPYGNGGNTSAVCIDFPASGTWQTDEQFATRDLAVAAGDATTVQQNASGQLPFTAKFAGTADPSATFDISVSSNAPSGVDLTPSTTKLTPDTDSSTPITVTANVPPTTPPGTYDVILTARGPGGQERSATGKLVVALGKPVNLALPFISGTDAVGQKVTCSTGDWSGSPGAFAYQWTRDGADIAGASSNSYSLTQSDGATLVACRVRATNDVGDSAPATSGPIRVAQEGGADVNLIGPVKVRANSDGTYTVDTGITVSCPPRLPKNCGGSNRVTTSASTAAGRAAATLTVARGGFAAPSGAKRKVVLKLTRRGSKLLRQKRQLRLVASVTTRNHALQRVTSRKQLTAKI